MDTRDLVEHELAAIASDRGAPRAQMARVAWEMVTGEGGPEDFTQLRVQQFCWDTLATTVEGTTDAKWQFTCALADLLDRLGLERYAAIARGSATREIVETERDGDVASSVVRESAWAASGIRPVDTELLTWGTQQGPGERYAYEQIAVALEMALLAGDMTPSGPGWHKLAAALTTKVLTTRQDELRGNAPLPGILEERFHRWASFREPERQALLFALGPALTSGESVLTALPGLSFELLGPLRYVLDRARVPVARSQVEDAAQASVVDVAIRSALVHDRDGRLLVTEQGRRALKSQAALATAFARGWVGRGLGMQESVRELVAALLLSDVGTVSDLVARVVELLTESGWRRGDGEQPAAGDVEPGVLEAWEELFDLGLLERPGWTLVLVEEARPLLLECLRQRLAHIDLPSPRLC